MARAARERSEQERETPRPNATRLRLPAHVLKRLSLSVAVVVGLLEPAVAATLGIVVLSEPVTVALVVGICLVMVGVAVTSLSTTAGRRR